MLHVMAQNLVPLAIRVKRGKKSEKTMSGKSRTTPNKTKDAIYNKKVVQEQISAVVAPINLQGKVLLCDCSYSAFEQSDKFI